MTSQERIETLLWLIKPPDIVLLNCCSQELARKERERQKKEEKEKEREKERERERQKKEEREREREKERQKKEEKGKKKKRLSSSKEERQIPRSPPGGAAVGPVSTSMKMKPNPSLGAMSHPYGVPVQQVSPRRVSGKAVSPTHAPDFLYGPQGQILVRSPYGYVPVSSAAFLPEGVAVKRRHKPHSSSKEKSREDKPSSPTRSASAQERSASPPHRQESKDEVKKKRRSKDLN